MNLCIARTCSAEIINNGRICTTAGRMKKMAICGINQRQVKALFFTHLCMHESIYLAIYSSPFPLLSPPQGLSNFLKDCQEDASFPLQLNPVSRVALF